MSWFRRCVTYPEVVASRRCLDAVEAAWFAEDPESRHLLTIYADGVLDGLRAELKTR